MINQAIAEVKSYDTLTYFALIIGSSFQLDSKKKLIFQVIHSNDEILQKFRNTEKICLRESYDVLVRYLSNKNFPVTL